MHWIYFILKKYLSGHKNIDLDDFRHPYFNFCLMNKIFFSSSSKLFRMFLEVFSSYSEQWDRWRRKYGKYWNKIEKKTLSSLLLVNFANFIRVLVSSFFVGILCFGAFWVFSQFVSKSFIQDLQSKSLTAFFTFHCNFYANFILGAQFKLWKNSLHFLLGNHTSKS